MKKNINLQKDIYGKDGTVICIMNAIITVGLGAISTSVQIIDENKIIGIEDTFKDEYESFMKDVQKEASSFGWGCLSDKE